MMTTYGQKGGEGPTRGKTAHVYEIALPDGTKIKKRTFGDYGDQAPATALKTREGKIIAAVWANGHVGWLGDFGGLVAVRVK